MMPAIRVGRLLPCTVVKYMSVHDSYLLLVTGTNLPAYLPKRYAGRRFNAGDRTTAVVFSMNEGKTILSRRSPQYFRRISEELLAPLIRQGKVKVKRAAAVVNGLFVKVSVEGLGGVDPLPACLPYLERAKEFTENTITIVRYSPDIKEYVVNSLVPAPVNRVRQVLYSHSLREAIVKVDPRYCGYFVGKGGTNVATAAKLLNVKIFIKSAGQIEGPGPEKSFAVV